MHQCSAGGKKHLGVELAEQGKGKRKFEWFFHIHWLNPKATDDDACFSLFFSIIVRGGGKAREQDRVNSDQMPRQKYLLSFLCYSITRHQ